MTHFAKIKTNFLRSSKSGTSLLVALGITTIIVLVSLGVTTVVVSSIRESANANGANQSYYAAEGALEAGLLVNQNTGAGYNLPSTSVALASLCVDTSPPKCDPSCYTLAGAASTAGINCGPTAGYKIVGQVPSDTNHKYADGYGIPAPGTGDAGTDCDSLHPLVGSPGFWYDTKNIDKKLYLSIPGTDHTAGADAPNYTNADAKEYPCNWGKLTLGKPISIPLYYTDPTTKQPVNIFTSTGTTLTVKLRTACDDGSLYCATRPTLDIHSGDAAYKYHVNYYDDPIVNWQIVGQSEHGDQNYVLSPYGTIRPLINSIWSIPNSILSKSIINRPPSGGALSNISVGEDSNGCTGSLMDFLKNGINGPYTNCATSNLWSTRSITKPILTLTLIHSLTEPITGKKIPNLEYQIITNTPAGASTPIADINQTITAEGYSGTFKQVLEVKNPQASGLLQYVIQQ